MSILNATVAPTFGVIVQDGSINDPTTGSPIAYGGKVLHHANHRLIMGGTGPFGALLAWSSVLDNLEPQDVREINAAAQIGLKTIYAGNPDYRRHPFAVVQIGVVDSERIVGFAYDSRSDFRPQEVRTGRHVIMPGELDAKAPGHRDLVDLAPLAGQGIQVERFHVELAKAQHHAMLAGRLKIAEGIGGAVTMVRIDAAGITTKQIAGLPAPLPSAA